MPDENVNAELEIANHEEASFQEDNRHSMPPGDIVTYNELRSCADLARMVVEEILDIHPDFQRDEVWPPASRTRFIDSVVKNLPIPSMCLSVDFKTQKWQVIDGLQRTSTIVKFLNEGKWRLSRLDDIDPRLSGATVEAIRNDHPVVYNTVRNTTIPINVIRIDSSKRQHNEYLFQVFHRLNTGGMKLNNQEIRNCIYNGTLNTWLKLKNDSPDEWQEIKRRVGQRQNRYKDIELILRFLAFYDRKDQYNGALATFLNDFMEDNRNVSQEYIETMAAIFDRTTIQITDKVLLSLPETITISTLEAIMFGIAKNIDNVESMDMGEIANRVSNLLEDRWLSAAELRGGISASEKVKGRLEAGEREFS